MSRFVGVARLIAVRGLRPACTILVLASLFFSPANAQQMGNPSAPLCVPADLASQVSAENGAVRVTTSHKPAALGNSGFAASGPVLTREALRAFRTFQHDARKGSPAAQVNLAVMYLAGWGTPPNAGTALYWLNAAAQQDLGIAFYDLGVLYFKGCGVRQDYAESFSYFQKGANAGDAPSQVNLGFLYENGLGVPRNRSAALAWYRRAAEKGDAQAQYDLADMYLHSDGVSPDGAAAFAWYQKAAFQGHTGARILLGSMYAAGIATQKDLVAAYSWISAAALQGDSRAAALLPVIERQLTPVLLAQAKSRARDLADAVKPSQELAQARQ